MKTIVFFSLISVLLFSCKRNVSELFSDDTDVQYVEYNPDRDDSFLRDSVFDKTWFVKLETNSRNLIGNVDLLLFLDNTIIVVDRHIAKAVYAFDMEGHFKKQISHLGNGPIEYLALHHVFITPNKEIGIVDNMKSRIMYFDVNGKFLRGDKTEIRGSEVEMMDAGSYAFNIYSGSFYDYPSLDDKSFVTLDKDGDPIYSFGKSLYGSGFHVTRVKNLYKFGDQVYCNNNFENTIYQLTPDGVCAKYKIRFADDKLEEPQFSSSEEFQKYIAENYFFNGKYVELKDYSYFAFIDPKLGELKLIYDHETGKCIRISNDLCNPVLSFLSSPVSRYSDNTLAETVPVNRILMFKETLLNAFADNAPLKELYDNLDLDSNPVVFFYNVSLAN